MRTKKNKIDNTPEKLSLNDYATASPGQLAYELTKRLSWHPRGDSFSFEPAFHLSLDDTKEWILLTPNQEATGKGAKGDRCYKFSSEYVGVFFAAMYTRIITYMNQRCLVLPKEPRQPQPLTPTPKKLSLWERTKAACKKMLLGFSPKKVKEDTYSEAELEKIFNDYCDALEQKKK